MYSSYFWGTVQESSGNISSLLLPRNLSTGVDALAHGLGHLVMNFWAAGVEVVATPVGEQIGGVAVGFDDSPLRCICSMPCRW